MRPFSQDSSFLCQKGRILRKRMIFKNRPLCHESSFMRRIQYYFYEKSYDSSFHEESSILVWKGLFLKKGWILRSILFSRIGHNGWNFNKRMILQKMSDFIQTIEEQTKLKKNSSFFLCMIHHCYHEPCFCLFSLSLISLTHLSMAVFHLHQLHRQDTTPPHHNTTMPRHQAKP